MGYESVVWWKFDYIEVGFSFYKIYVWLGKVTNMLVEKWSIDS